MIIKSKTFKHFPTVDFFLKHPLHSHDSHFSKPLTFSVSFYEDGRLKLFKIKNSLSSQGKKTDNDLKKYFNKKIRSRLAILEKILHGYFFKGNLKNLEEVHDWLDFSNFTATPLQKQVWHTMLYDRQFSAGNIVSYEDLTKISVRNFSGNFVGSLKNKSHNKSHKSRFLEKSDGLYKKGLPIRAVASAVAKNPFFLLVPCHRIVPKHSIEKSKKFKGLPAVKIIEAMDVGQYGSGALLKKELLLHEAKIA